MTPVNIPALAYSVQPTVQIENGQVITTSIEVARVFGKEHKHVLDAIRKLLSDLGADRQPNFRQTVETRPNPSGGEPIKSPAYHLTRDGFTLLAMRFTGKKALAFQVAYIEAFNQMEAALTAKTSATPAVPLPAPDDSRTEKAYALAQQTASMVSDKVFRAAASGRYNFSDGRWQILVSRCGTQVSLIDPNAAILTPAQFINGMRTGDVGSLWTVYDLMHLVQATLDRLKYQFGRLDDARFTKAGQPKPKGDVS